MTLRTAACVAALLALAHCSCSRSADTPVPRPVAYPRVQLYDSSYVAVPRLPLHFEISSAASANASSRPDNSTWLNVTYPAYGATLYCTFTPVTPASAQAVIANRTERMSLNSGSNTTEITRLTAPSGFQSQILFTPAGSLTPVQFISVSPRWVVSGSLRIDGADTRPDSVAPILYAVRRDLIHAAKTIR